MITHLYINSSLERLKMPLNRFLKKFSRYMLTMLEKL
uniref:Uncharacterized protein n=1 Tax=Podoviridae sp. ctZkC8 TaxID=2825259 RepID=A0A8S5UC65_9CAUD|nr:MAG TPA: hypothetical protein [Podoviridae sp. ctZkC8]